MGFSTSCNQSGMPSQGLYPFFLYLADVRTLRIHGVDRENSDEADLKVLVADEAIGCFEVNIREIDVKFIVFIEFAFDR